MGRYEYSEEEKAESRHNTGGQEDEREFEDAAEAGLVTHGVLLPEGL
jgi:hypothetical protein